MVTSGDSHAVVTPEPVNRKLPLGVDRLPSGAFRARVVRDGRQISVGTFPNATAAGRAAATARAEIGKGQWVDPKRGAITLDDWMVLWWPNRTVRPSTQEKDQDRYRVNIKPYLGTIPLHRLTPFQVQRWIGQLQADGKTPSSIKKAHTLLKTALGVRGAVGDQRIGFNPCLIVQPETVPRKQFNLLTRDQFERILDNTDEQWQPILLVAAFGGLRWSEIAALTRTDYNPLAGTLTVTKSIDSKGRVGETKNRRHRTVPLTPRVVEALNAQPLGDRLFTSPTGQRLSYSNFTHRVWRPACEKAGVAARFHDLRHSCASWLLAGGATVAEVRDMLGHSSITVTELYLHTDKDGLAATVRRALG